MNVQFVVMPDKGQPAVYVIEVNPRASRTVPFISKVTGVPLVSLAIDVMLGASLRKLGHTPGLCPSGNLVAVKAPVFSMSKLAGVDTYLGPEMKSTGEVMGVDFTFEAALAKALLASGLMLPTSGALLLSIADRDKAEAQPLIAKLAQLGFKLYATEGTAVMIRDMGLEVTRIGKKLSQGHPHVVDIIREGKVLGVLNTLTYDRTPLKDGFHIRRAAVEKRIPCFTSLDTARVAIEAVSRGPAAFNILRLGDYRSSAALTCG